MHLGRPRKWDIEKDADSKNESRLEFLLCQLRPARHPPQAESLRAVPLSSMLVRGE
jgi:hypothetical protein